MARVKKNSAASKKASAKASNYNPYLDVLKGLAILLVVLGHSLQTYVANGAFDQNVFFRIIYSFHMPLFMFLAGAAAAYSLRPMNWEFIQRKFYMLVIPFVAWYLLGYALFETYKTITFKTYIHQLVLSPDHGLWFLWVLFLNFCALVLIKFLSKWLKLYSYLIVWLAIYAIPTGKYGIGLVKWHLPFFLLGYLIFTYREQLAKYRTPVLAICVISAPFLIASWHRLYYPHLLTTVEPRLISHGIQAITIGDLASFNTYSFLLLFYKYAVPLAAIGFIFWVLQLKPSRYFWGFFGFIGLYTLEIYAMNLLLMRYSFGSSPTMRIISGFIIATTLSLLIGIFVLRRVPILSTIFLGGRTKPAGKSIKQ